MLNSLKKCVKSKDAVYMVFDTSALVDFVYGKFNIDDLGLNLVYATTETAILELIVDESWA